MNHPTVTEVYVRHLAYVVDTPGQRVVRLAEDGGDLIEGTARYLTGDGDTRRPDDVRDAFLRVTLLSGFEVWWPVAELVEARARGGFAVRP
jgi:hypothetical protein